MCSISAKSNAITLFYKQIILQKGLPFEVKLPDVHPLDITVLAEDDLHAELEKGYADIAAGLTKDVNAVFDEIRRDYGL